MDQSHVQEVICSPYHWSLYSLAKEYVWEDEEVNVRAMGRNDDQGELVLFFVAFQLFDCIPVHNDLLVYLLEHLVKKPGEHPQSFHVDFRKHLFAYGIGYVKNLFFDLSIVSGRLLQLVGPLFDHLVDDLLDCRRVDDIPFGLLVGFEIELLSVGEGPVYVVEVLLAFVYDVDMVSRVWLDLESQQMVLDTINIESDVVFPV